MDMPQKELVVVVVVVEGVPWRGRKHNDFGEEKGLLNGGKVSHHANYWMSHLNTRLDLKLVKNGEQVICIAMEGGITLETEMLRVCGPSTHVVK